ncbi:uncharacterized protein LOC122505587 [Leptopilina heterotoma]|uniref:uncharacterized protein LOC122505587 n=1 Tax=Leptopilina heterotoma TaxID=63436 RepID=UPI001CA8D07E|nr:uncharacterized protein LOC122505587 [Leptopilina heterotoma]
MTMFKLICLLIPFVVLSNALDRKVTVFSGYIMQGRNSSGLIVRTHDDYQEIIWGQKFDNLKVHYHQINEKTGKLEYVELANLCASLERGSFKNSLKQFILSELQTGWSLWRCAIQKGTKKISYPISFSFQTKSLSMDCGPIVTTINIVQNNRDSSGKTPLLLSILFRGMITGNNCKK